MKTEAFQLEIYLRKREADVRSWFVLFCFLFILFALNSWPFKRVKLLEDRSSLSHRFGCKMAPTKPAPVSKCQSGTTMGNLNYLFANLLHPPVYRPCSSHKVQCTGRLFPWPEKFVPLPVFWNDVKMKSTLGLSQKQHWKSTASPKNPLTSGLV